MTEWYFQIKGMAIGGELTHERWTWPPLFSGRVVATTSKRARKKIELMYGTQLPGRMANDANGIRIPYLLNIQKMTPQLLELFLEHPCKECGRSFKRIDLYNDFYETYKGPDFCSQHCADTAKAASMVPGADDPYGNKCIPCIYKITNKHTGMAYVGQTQQAFTLRWWQHIKWGSTDCKFHVALRESQLTDWIFEVIEIVDDVSCLNAREAYHIAVCNSIECGYNSVSASTKVTDI